MAVSTRQLSNITSLRQQLTVYLTQGSGQPHWGVEQLLAHPRGPDLMTCVWGATVTARIQFLLLEALRQGILPWDQPWELSVVEHETAIAEEALSDFSDRFGRLREFHGESMTRSQSSSYLCQHERPRICFSTSL